MTKEDVKSLEDKIYLTRKCRINAAERLKSWDVFMSGVNIYYSALMVVFSVIALAYENSLMINISLISSSVLTIGFSSVMLSLQLKDRYLAFKNCYNELTTLVDKLQILRNKDSYSPKDKAEFKEIKASYDKIIASTENHNSKDYYVALRNDQCLMNQYLSRYEGEKIRKKECRCIKNKHFFCNACKILVRILMIIAPLILPFLIYWIKELLFIIA